MDEKFNEETDASTSPVDDDDEIRTESEENDENEQPVQKKNVSFIGNIPLPIQLRPRLSTQLMVQKAISELAERNGSSIIAIKKFIFNNYKDINEKRLATSIKLTVKKLIANGTLIQIKQSFKLAPTVKQPRTKPILKEKLEQPKTKKVKDKKIELQKMDDEKPSTSKTALKQMRTTIAAANANSKKQKSLDEPIKEIPVPIAIISSEVNRKKLEPKTNGAIKVQKEIVIGEENKKDAAKVKRLANRGKNVTIKSGKKAPTVKIGKK